MEGGWVVRVCGWRGWIDGEGRVFFFHFTLTFLRRGPGERLIDMCGLYICLFVCLFVFTYCDAMR